MDEKYLTEKRKYREILNLNPFNAEAHYELGNVLYAEEKFEEAEKEYAEAIKLNPKFADAYNAMGKLLQIYAEKPRVKYSTEWNSEIILPDPKKFSEAEKFYRTAITLDPYYVEAHNNLGNLLFKLGRFTQAKKCYEEILKFLPNFAEAHCNLGFIFFNEGNFAEAESEYRKTLKIEPDFAEAYEMLGAILLKTKRTNEGLKCLEHALFLKSELRDEIEEIKKGMM